MQLLLCLVVAAVLGLILGGRREGGEHAAAIERVAARHARQVGPADCAGRPDREGGGLVVACGQGERMRVYRVDPSGRIERVAPNGI